MKKLLFVFFFTINLLCSAVVSADSKVYFYSANHADYSKAKSLLFEKGILLRSNQLSYPDYKAAYFWSVQPKSLTKIFSYIKEGGNVWMDVTEYDTEDNDFVQDIFGFSIVREQTTRKAHSLVIDGGSLFGLWKGLKIGAYPDGAEAAILTYLILRNKDEWNCTFITSESTGKKRIVSAYKKIGKGKLLVMCQFQWPLIFRNSIDIMDNKKAVIDIMFPWLIK